MINDNRTPWSKCLLVSGVHLPLAFYGSSGSVNSYRKIHRREVDRSTRSRLLLIPGDARSSLGLGDSLSTTCHEADAFPRTYRMVLLGVLVNQGWEDRNPEGGRLPESRASASNEGARPKTRRHKRRWEATL